MLSRFAKITLHTIFRLSLVVIFSCENMHDKQSDYHKSMSINYDSLLEKRKVRSEQRERFAEFRNQENEWRYIWEEDSLVYIDNDDLPLKRENASLLYADTIITKQNFNNDIRCQDTVLAAITKFNKCKFINEVDLHLNTSCDIEFSEGIFSNELNIRNSAIDGNLSFPSSIFKKYTNISDIKVSDSSNFSYSLIIENAIFNRDTFYDHFNINSTRFFNSLNFWNSRFEGDADFSGLEIEDSAYLYFGNCVLPQKINFAFISGFKKEIDLTTANFSDPLHYNKLRDIYFKPHYISLYKSDISKFHLDYIHFRLIIDSAETIDEYGTCSRFKLPQDEISAMYEALLINFKNRGQTESYKLLDIEYLEYKWKNSAIPFFSVFSKYWWNFGYNKEKIFLWTPFFILFFMLFNFFCLDGLNKVYPLSNIGPIPSIISRRFTVFDSLKRMWLSFVYTSTIFFKLTLKVELINYRRVWGTLYIFLVYTVGIICLAYMANFIIQK